MIKPRFFVFLPLLVLLLTPTGGLRAGAGEILFVSSFEGTGGVPQFVPIDPQAGVVDRLIEIDIDTAVPSDQAGLTFSLDAAPAGLTIRAGSGEIDWIPGAPQVGTNAVTVRVEDLAGLSNTLSFDIEVIDSNAAPLLEAIDDQGVAPGSLLALTVVANDPDGAGPPGYTLDQAPSGMTLDPVSGALEWVPALADIGSHPVTVRATDDGGRFDVESFTVVVAENTPPSLDPLPDRGGAPGVAMLIQPSADDPDPGDVLAWSLTERPPGMSIDPDTGAIDWTPTTLQLGPHDVTVAVADALGTGDQQSFNVFVDLNRAPVAVDDAGYRIERGDTLEVPAPGVLTNDSDPNGDVLSAQLQTPPLRGALTLAGDGSFEYTPDNPTGSIGFDLKWDYEDTGGGDPYSPMIANLDADPAQEIVIYEGGTFNNELIALDGITGAVEWKRVFEARDLAVGSRGAIGDIDLDGLPEILFIGGEADQVPTEDTLIYAFEHHGGVKWVSEPLARRYIHTGSGEIRNEGTMALAAITLADLDQDGIPEILVAPDGAGNTGPARYQVWDAEGRKIDSAEDRAAIGFASSAHTRVEVVDLDLDGDPEIVAGASAWSHDGEVLWSRADSNIGNRFPSEFPVIANVDDDPYPELIRRLGGLGARGDLTVWNHDGTDLWNPAAIPRDSYLAEMPLTVADVDADGRVEILMPGDGGEDLFEVINGNDGSVKWSKNVPTRRGGATVFDLDRDGFPEVVFADETGVAHVWDGRDGTSKFTLDLVDGSASGPPDTTVPIFVDLDADGSAELVTPIGGAFSFASVIRVWESPNGDWAPMRSIWNQHRYYVTNVNDDLTIPSHPLPHWLQPGLNQVMINQRLPEARVEESDFFEYTAFDGELSSNVARVDIEILPPNAAPRILSTPTLLASPGFEYVYNLLAVDADPGELLTFAIDEGPAGMNVDANGQVRWTPSIGDLGPHPVVVSVTDSIGVSAYQNFVLEVTDPVTVPDLSGLDEAAAVAALEALSLRADPLRDVFSDTVAPGNVAAQDPAPSTQVAAGAGITVEVSRGPVPVPVPPLVGQPLEDAVAGLTSAGLGADPVEWTNDPNVPRGMVLSQDPAPGTGVPPASDVALTVSGGPRAVIAVDPPIIPAGDAASVTVSVRDVDGTPLDPQPPVTLSLVTDPGSLFGTPPTLVDATIQTAADSQGEFRVQASFTTRGAESVSATSAVLPAISDGPGGTVYSEFAQQIETFGELIDALIEAVDLGDGPAIEALDQELGDLEAAIDVRRLRTMTPFAVDGGMLPTPAQAIGGGLVGSIEDSPYAGAGLDLLVLLEEIDALVRAGSVPDVILNLLNQELAAAASAKAALEPSDLGVLRAVPQITAILGTYAPRVVVADIRAIRQALRDGGILSADGTAQAGRFTLPGILTAGQIRRRIISNIYVPYLGEAARMLGAVIAADVLQTYFNAGAIVGIITGASQSIHVFEVKPSAIEGFGFNPTLSPNNAVTMIGPSLFEAASTAAGGLSSANSVKDVNSAIDFVQDVIDNGSALQKAWDEANSLPMGVGRGCILNGTPGCSQLVYPDGFASVYEASGVLNLPGPVLIIANNLESGSWAVFVANFVPTKPED